MHAPHAKHLSPVTINALWCLLIAVTLVTLPLIARQARLRSPLTQLRLQAAPTLHESTRIPTQTPLLVAGSDTPAPRH